MNKYLLILLLTILISCSPNNDTNKVINYFESIHNAEDEDIEMMIEESEKDNLASRFFDSWSITSNTDSSYLIMDKFQNIEISMDKDMNLTKILFVEDYYYDTAYYENGECEIIGTEDIQIHNFADSNRIIIN